MNGSTLALRSYCYEYTRMDLHRPCVTEVASPPPPLPPPRPPLPPRHLVPLHTIIPSLVLDEPCPGEERAFLDYCGRDLLVLKRVIMRYKTTVRRSRGDYAVGTPDSLSSYCDARSM